MVLGTQVPAHEDPNDFGEEQPSLEGERVAVLGASDHKFPNNYIRTTRYRWWNFFFINLFEQFMKVSNIFFLLNLIIALIPGVSPILPITSILPLIFVVAVSMIKDGIEDLSRYQADRAANSTPIAVLRGGRFIQVPSEDIHVGDILRLCKDDAVPCDAILLGSSNTRETGGGDGVAFIDTAQIDGETNLKPRNSVSAALSSALTTVAAINAFVAGDARVPVSATDAANTAVAGADIPHHSLRDQALVPNGGVVVTGDPPSAVLSAWNGRLCRVRTPDGAVNTTPQTPPARRSGRSRTPPRRPTNVLVADTVPLDLENILLRGHVVRNTAHVYLACVYSGQDTKLSKNLRTKRTKRSSMDSQLNSLVAILLGVFLVFTLGLAGLQLWAVHRGNGFKQNPYITTVYDGESDVKTFFFGFFTYFILMSYMMPISLFVSMELVKAFQAVFMKWDDLMSDADLRSPFMDHPALRLASRSALEGPRAKAGGAAVHVHSDASDRDRGGRGSSRTRGARSDANDRESTNASHQNSSSRRRHSVVAASGHGIRAVQAAEADDISFDEDGAAKDVMAAFKEAASGPQPRRMAVKSSGLNDELAVVAAVFSDKTGTLTENIMRFHSASYGFHGRQPIPFFGSTMVAPPDQGGDSELCNWTEMATPAGGVAPMVSATASTDTPGDTIDATRGVGALFLTAIATCHGVLSAPAPGGEPLDSAGLGPDEGPHVMSPLAAARGGVNAIYEGPSTDEVALVSGAAANGFTLVSRTNDTVTVRVPSIPAVSAFANATTNVRYAGGHAGSEDPMMLASAGSTCDHAVGPMMTWRVAAQLPFNSDRKRMSVVVQLDHPSDPPGPDGFGVGDFFVFAKGADATMLPLLRGVTPSSDGLAGVPNWAAERLHNYSLIGLRTLVTAYRTIPAAQVRGWLESEWRPACVSLGDSREALKEAAAVSIEQQLTLLGVTAVEDELQQGVPETIEWLLNAGILVWVLTGDKRETAYNIAVIANIITVATDTVLHIRGNSEEDVIASLTGALLAAPPRPSKILRHALRGNKILETFPPPPAHAAHAVHPQETEKGGRTTMIIDGQALEFVFRRGSPALALFQRLSLVVDAGICCRVMPLQKANVVKLFRNYGLVCCSIGDGANDVPMILEATVGVGVMGLEGSQAERASDYAVPKFRHLTRLLAVHGRRSHCGNAFLIQYSFYKNITLSLCQVWYAWYNGFTGQTLFDSWVLTFFNVVFTSVPPLIIGTLEKDLDDVSVMQFPRAYQELADGLFFGARNIAFWILGSVIHSVIIFVVAIVDASHANADDGSCLSVAGTIGSTALITVVLLKAALHNKMWTIVTIGSIALSIAFYLLFIYAYNAILIVPTTGTSAYYGVVDMSFSHVRSLGWLFVAIVLLFVADLAWLSPSRTWVPSVRDRLLGRAHMVREHAYSTWVPQWLRFLMLCCCCCPTPVTLSTLRSFYKSRHWLFFTKHEQPHLRPKDHAMPGSAMLVPPNRPRTVPPPSFDAPRISPSRNSMYPHPHDGGYPGDVRDPQPLPRSDGPYGGTLGAGYARPASPAASPYSAHSPTSSPSRAPAAYGIIPKTSQAPSPNHLMYQQPSPQHQQQHYQSQHYQQQQEQHARLLMQLQRAEQQAADHAGIPSLIHTGRESGGYAGPSPTARQGVYELPPAIVRETAG